MVATPFVVFVGAIIAFASSFGVIKIVFGICYLIFGNFKGTFVATCSERNDRSETENAKK